MSHDRTSAESLGGHAEESKDVSPALTQPDLSARIAALSSLEMDALKAEWRRLYRAAVPKRLSRDLLVRAIAWELQAKAHGGLSKSLSRRLKSLATTMESQGPGTLDSDIRLKPGTKLIREWQGDTHRALVLENGFEYRGTSYRSLSQIARTITGARWSGPRFFGLKQRPRPFANRDGVGDE